DAENSLGEADITVNKNMVPFDDKSPFVTSGMRVGTPAITTRGLTEEHMSTIVEFIDRVITSGGDEAVIAGVRAEVNELMSSFPLFSHGQLTEN
ncbi:MAG: serine hydroxymethyltransferase, partial [Bacteroidota bacterium]